MNKISTAQRDVFNKQHGEKRNQFMTFGNVKW